MDKDLEMGSTTLSCLITFRLTFPIFFTDQSLEENIDLIFRVIELQGKSPDPKIYFVDEYGEESESAAGSWLKLSEAEPATTNGDDTASASFEFSFEDVDLWHPKSMSAGNALSAINWTVTPNTPFDDEISSVYKIHEVTTK
jgi:hypothetical protein